MHPGHLADPCRYDLHWDRDGGCDRWRLRRTRYVRSCHFNSDLVTDLVDAGNLTIAPGGELTWVVDGSASAVLNVEGCLNVNGTSLNVQLNGDPSGSQYTLVSGGCVVGASKEVTVRITSLYFSLSLSLSNLLFFYFFFFYLSRIVAELPAGEAQL